jgi:transketolase
MAHKKSDITMRDALIGRITEVMRTRRDIFFLSADFGAPALDALRTRFPSRFFNVGIAEQNLINIASGLALEGYTVFAYSIAPFITMRCFEQIRVNLSLMSQYRPVNVNLIGVGAGTSYDISGPTHHCIEDLSIMRTLPNIDILSPGDAVITRKFVDFMVQRKRPKYLRLDSKLLKPLYSGNEAVPIRQGFNSIRYGRDAVIIATGSMVHKAVRVSERLRECGRSVGVVDFFMLRPFNENALVKILKKSPLVITVEEAFINKGGLDALVSGVVLRNGLKCAVRAFGYRDSFITESSTREELARKNRMSDDEIIHCITSSRAVRN